MAPGSEGQQSDPGDRSSWSRRCRPRAASAARARALVREVLEHGGAAELVDTAQLAVSEVITNALVHAGTAIQLRIVLADGPQRRGRRRQPALPVPARLHAPGGHRPRPAPARRHRGRVGGLRPGRGQGRLVRARADAAVPPRTARRAAPTTGTAPRSWRRAPQRPPPHARRLAGARRRAPPRLPPRQLDDDPDALELHAQASDALNLLHDQLPAPDLGDDPAAMMATAIEPRSPSRPPCSPYRGARWRTSRPSTT